MPPAAATAWENSLFEDGAEFGYGMNLAVNARQGAAADLAREIAAGASTPPTIQYQTVLFLVIAFDREAQQVEGAFQLGLAADVGDADLALAGALGGVKAAAGGEHDGLPVVLEFVQQIHLEFFRAL